MDAHRIRDELRRGRSRQLARNRAIIAVSAAGMADFSLITLYQTGALRRLPDPPGRWFDSNRVNASARAYPLGIPDAALGAAAFALDAILAAAGGSRRTGRTRLLDGALGALALAGAASALHYLWIMLFRQRKGCPYCILGAFLYLSLVPLAAPGARESLAPPAGGGTGKR